MDVDLVGSEAVGIVLEILGARPPFVPAEEVTAAAVGIERDLVAEGAAQQAADRLAQQLAGEIPERDVDGAQHAHDPATLGVGVEHVVKVDVDGQRVLADQAQVGQARPFQMINGRADKGTGAVAWPDPEQAGVGLHLDQRGPALGLEDLDVGDLDCVSQTGGIGKCVLHTDFSLRIIVQIWSHNRFTTRLSFLIWKGPIEVECQVIRVAPANARGGIYDFS